MAKYPFAEQARKAMEENGIVFNADGSTGVAQPNELTNPNPQGVVETPPAQQQNANSQGGEQTAQDERDKLIEMQRAELDRLRAKEAEWGKQPPQQEAKSQRELELENELADLRSKLDAQQQQEQEDELRAILDAQEFNGELDDDVYIEIRDKFVKPMANKITQLEGTIKTLNERNREPTDAEKLEQTKRSTQAGVIKEIPDFLTIFKSDGFQKRLLEKDNRFPNRTYGEALQIAYENGNTDFIVREVKAFMNGTAPDIGSIADVGATNGVGNKPTAKPSEGGFTFSDEEAAQMLQARRFNTISRQEYSEYRAKLDAHRSRQH